MILGNSAKVVEQHYGGWNLARQKKLEQLVRTTWQIPALVRVKQPEPEFGDQATSSTRL